MIPDRNSGWLSLDSSLSIDMCQQWTKIFVYPTSDPDRNTFGDMSDLTLCRSYITHDSSKHFESIIILNHAYVWSIESHGWPKTFVSHSGLQYTNTFGDMRRQRSSRVDQTPFLPPFLPPTERRYNGGKNAGTTAVQRRPDRASSILKTLFRTYVCIVRRASYRILLLLSLALFERRATPLQLPNQNHRN